MTDTDDARPTHVFDPATIHAAEGLDPVDSAFATLLRIQTLLWAVPLAIALTLLDALLIPRIGGPAGLLTTLGWIGAAILIVTVPPRRAARWGFRIGEGELRVARGWLFRTDTIVPFVRVQHIDVGQGPIERWLGLSHLIVHTSGTHNSMVVLPGLPADLAASARETIRHHIQTDFA